MVLQVENYDRIEDVKQTDRVDPKAEQEVRALEPFFLGKKKEGDPNLSKIAEEVRTVKNDVKEVKDDIKALRETLDPENLDFAAINSSMREHMRNAVDSYWKRIFWNNSKETSVQETKSIDSADVALT